MRSLSLANWWTRIQFRYLFLLMTTMGDIRTRPFGSFVLPIAGTTDFPYKFSDIYSMYAKGLSSDPVKIRPLHLGFNSHRLPYIVPCNACVVVNLVMADLRKKIAISYAGLLSSLL